MQRSTFGVPVKITSSNRFAGMIWLTFSDGLARSRIGRLRTRLHEARASIVEARPASRRLLREQASCALLARRASLSSSAEARLRRVAPASTSSSPSRCPPPGLQRLTAARFPRALAPSVHGLVVLVAGHVDACALVKR